MTQTKRLNKLPGDSVSYFRRNEIGGFWHDGSIWSYNPQLGGFDWVKDLPEADLDTDEQDALDKRRRYFGVSN